MDFGPLGAIFYEGHFGLAGNADRESGFATRLWFLGLSVFLKAAFQAFLAMQILAALSSAAFPDFDADLASLTDLSAGGGRGGLCVRRGDDARAHRNEEQIR